MDDCEELRLELDDLNSWYRWEIGFCVLKAILALVGMDWIVDVLRGRKSLGEAFGILEGLLVFLLALDVAAVVTWLKDKLPEVLDKLPLGEALKQQLKKVLGPVALFFLAVDIFFAIKGFLDCRKLTIEAFNSRVKEIYGFYSCEDKDRIFTEKGIDIPSAN